MNQFNDIQLEVIESLARSYHEQMSRKSLWDLPEHVLLKLRDTYVKDITTGLTDPDYWED